MAKVKLHPRWGDRRIVKKAQGVVILERETIDIVVAYDVPKGAKQKFMYWTLMGNRTRAEAMKAATKEFKRRQK